MILLDRKLVRDLWRMKSQVIAICIVMACGVATFIMSLSTIRSLEETKQTYYERNRFAHIFAQLKRAPRALEERLREIDGIVQLETRIVREVNLSIEGMREPAVGRLVSIPEGREPLLNQLHLRRGRLPEPRRSDEVLVHEAFAAAHGFIPGDRFEAIINGRLQVLQIVGIALSPEYVYQVGAGELLPDDKRFGVLWMGRDSLAAAFDMEGAFNDVAALVARGSHEDEVIARVDDLLEEYGGLGAYGRREQMSNRFIEDELEQLRVMAVLPPAIFLGVSSFLISMVIGRLVHTQREQIATLKAFGYRNREIGLHYVKYIVLLVAIGGGIGTALGWWFGHTLTEMYTKFFRFPYLVFRPDEAVVAMAFLITLGAGGIGAHASIRKAVRLPPAEAMRPEPPPEFRPTVLERLGFRRITIPTRMVLRKLESHPVRAGVSVLGLSLAVAVVILGRFAMDAIDEVIEFEWNLVQRQDVTVTFVEATSRRAIHDLEAMPGVIHVEPFRVVPVRMRHAHRTKRLGIVGLETEPRLNRVLDSHSRVKNVPRDGLLISDKLADILDVEPGDTILLEVLEGERTKTEARVEAVYRGYIGVGAYMHIDSLNRLMGEGRAISGAYLLSDEASREELYHELKETPRVASVRLRESILESFRKTIAENLWIMRTVNLIFAVAIAFGVVYNNSRITLAERSRELASLRVLGMRPDEVGRIVLGELLILTALAIPLGILIGRELARFATSALETETHSIPFRVSAETYAFAAIVVAFASVASGVVIRRVVHRLDLISVLKNVG